MEELPTIREPTTSRLLKERILPLSVFACASSPEETDNRRQYIVDSVHHFDGR